MEERQIELSHSNYRRISPHLIPNIFIIKSRVSLGQHWHRIFGRNERGMESQMGCGFNVLAYLQILPREVAQEFINMLVKDDYDEIGLLIPSMIIFLELYFREHLYIDRYYWDWSENGIDTDLSITNFFDKLMDEMRREYDLQRENLDQEFYFYTIFKLLFDIETGLGHSVILRFNALENVFDVIDPQKDRITPVELYKHYLCSHLAGMYSGASVIVHNLPENELENTHIPHRRGSRRRNSRNRGTHRRSSQQRGYNSRRTRNNRGNHRRSIISQSIIRGGTKIHDSDFSHLSKLEEQKLEEASNKEDMFFKKLNKSKKLKKI
jgi:hypothetical protein